MIEVEVYDTYEGAFRRIDDFAYEWTFKSKTTISVELYKSDGEFNYIMQPPFDVIIGESHYTPLGLAKAVRDSLSGISSNTPRHIYTVDEIVARDKWTAGMVDQELIKNLLMKGKSLSDIIDLTTENEGLSAKEIKQIEQCYG